VTVRVVDTSAEARKTFRAFHDKDSSRTVPMRFQWPREMQEIGKGRAEMYSSNKWQKNATDYEDYKHVVESSRLVYQRPGWIRSWGSPRAIVPAVGPMVAFEEPMPRHFARLGPVIGIQVQLYEERDGEHFLPNGRNFYEIRAPRCSLGAAKHPKTGETLLFIHDSSEIYMVLAGGELDISKDGIVG